MSIVAEVLQSTGKLAKENIVLKVDDLKRKLEVIKLDVEEALKHKYVDFIPQYIKMDKLLHAFRRFSVDYEQLHNQIEKEIKPQMVNSVAEFHDVLDDLKKTRVLKAVVGKLIKLHQHLESAKKSQSQCAYLDAAHCLIEFEIVFKEIESNNPKDIAIMCCLKTEFYVTKESMIYELETIWKKNVVISSQMEGRNKKFITLSLDKERAGFEELLKALHMLNNLRPVLRSFGKQFLKLMCEVLILNHVKVHANENCVLTIDILNAQSPPPSEVFESIKTVLQFIYDKLLILPVVNEDGTEIASMSEFGAVIGEDFCSLIIEKCLKVAIPKQSKQLEAFHLEIVAADNFCNALKEMEFISSNNLLMNFIRNVDVLPVNKMAQDILSRARSLMKKSLHQTVTHGVESTPSAEADEALNMNETTRKKSGLSKATFSYPRCQISVSMKELVKLLNEVKEEAKNIGPAHAPRLYYVARCICELYCSVVPTVHKEEIQNIPQQTAIFHNNCMYLAHEICILGSHYECELQAQIPMTFVDLVPEIKKLGTEAFLSQMRHQKQQLLQLIQEQQAYQTIMMDEGLINKAEKSIRQCLCQLQLLKKVWSDILPSEVYFKAIGTLLNTVLEEIILRILSMEDISADAAAQMDNIFSILLKQGPDLFEIQSIDKKNSVHIYVKRWFKFQELQLVLSANLKEIVDRWASGKGPLASHFSSDDVKHLIRALFQNTERRAAALAKIR